MVGLNEPELFERLKHYNLKVCCHKVSAALLSALLLYVHLTPYIVPLDSDNVTTLKFSLEGDETHTLTVTLIPAIALMSLLFLQSDLFNGNFRWQVGHTKRINHLFDNLQEAAFHNGDNIYIDTTFCKTDFPISYLVGRAVFQPSCKRCPNGSVHFKIKWFIFVTKLATVMSF